MYPADHPLPNQPEPVLPPRLREDLAALVARPVAVPPEVDAAMRVAARRHFARRRRVRRLVAWAGAAAAVALVALTLRLATTTHKPPTAPRMASKPAAPAPRQVAREDIDRDGRIDILDAFALARHLKAQDTPLGAWDLNGDGEVDAADVKVVAQAAVSLERGVFQ